MFEYLRTCDIFVLPTLSEGTPRVLVEARANSIPVISTNVGGIPTSITDGFDGLLVNPKDSEAIAEAINLIAENDTLRKKLIANGLKSVRNMTVDKFAKRVIGLINGDPDNG
jgi:glycosyltransferase involved in cell wall biosynthesis